MVPGVGLGAAFAQGEIGEAAAPALGPLRAAVQNRPCVVQKAAEEAIDKIE